MHVEDQTGYLQYGSISDTYESANWVFNVVPEQSTSLFRIKNVELGTYLYADGSQVKYGEASAVEPSAHWSAEITSDGRVRIKNRATGGYMNTESRLGYIECTAVPDYFWNSQWIFQYDSGSIKIRAREVDEYLHVDGGLGYAQYGSVSDESAKWVIEALTGASVSYFRIKNENYGTYLYADGSQVRYGEPSVNDPNSYWIQEPTADGKIRFKNRGTGGYLNYENSPTYMQCTVVPEIFWCSQWEMEYDSNSCKIRGRETTNYLHVEGQAGYLQYGSITDTYESADWVFEALPENSVTYYRIKNMELGTYLYADEGKIKYGNPLITDPSSHWTKEIRTDGAVKLFRRDTKDCMHIQNNTGYIECYAVPEVFWSSHWYIEEHSGYSKVYSRGGMNYWNTEDELGYLQYSPTANTLDSGKWIFEEVIVPPAAQPEPITIPAGMGADQDWITIQAEDMTTNATKIGPANTIYTVEAEASGSMAVKLQETGEYVEFTASQAINSLVLRYSIPDSVAGGGIDATLSMYIDDVHYKDLQLTSKYAWLYGICPWSNTPSTGDPRRFYDEIRLLTGSLQPGQIITLKMDVGDTADYYIIDKVDVENVAAPLAMPAGFLSIDDYGAVADDGEDDTNAIYACMDAAKSAGTGVWIPIGTYHMDEDLPIMTEHTGYTGTGYIDFNQRKTNVNTIVDISSEGTYPVSIYYSNGTGANQTLSIWENSIKVKTITFAPTANWDTWAVHTENLFLKEFEGLCGLRFIIDSGDSGNVCVDKISAGGQVYQIENTTYTNPIYVDNVTIKGAGMWYSSIKGKYTGIIARGSNVKLYDFSLTGEENARIANTQMGLNGYFGTGSEIHNIWIEHMGLGIWVGNPHLGNTDGLLIEGCRIRNNVADGTNLCYGTKNTVVQNCQYRYNGDDSLAIWPSGFQENLSSSENNTIINNTVELSFHGHAIALYGGKNHTVSNNVMVDVSPYGGMKLSTEAWGFKFGGTTTITNNYIYRTTCFGYYSGFEIKNVDAVAGVSNVVIDGLYIYDTNNNGISIYGNGHPVSNITFNNVTINGTAMNGICINSDAKGEVTFSNTAISNTQGIPYINKAGSNFIVNSGAGNVGW